MSAEVLRDALLAVHKGSGRSDLEAANRSSESSFSVYRWAVWNYFSIPLYAPIITESIILVALAHLFSPVR